MATLTRIPEKTWLQELGEEIRHALDGKYGNQGTNAAQVVTVAAQRHQKGVESAEALRERIKTLRRAHVLLNDRAATLNEDLLGRQKRETEALITAAGDGVGDYQAYLLDVVPVDRELNAVRGAVGELAGRLSLEETTEKAVGIELLRLSAEFNGKLGAFTTMLTAVHSAKAFEWSGGLTFDDTLGRGGQYRNAAKRDHEAWKILHAEFREKHGAVVETWLATYAQEMITD